MLGLDKCRLVALKCKADRSATVVQYVERFMVFVHSKVHDDASDDAHFIFGQPTKYKLAFGDLVVRASQHLVKVQVFLLANLA